MNSPALKVLLIEDDHVQARALGRALQQKLPLGSSISHSALLSAGLDLLRAERFDVAVVDLSLPDSEGSETVQAVRALSADIAIIVLTGDEEDTTVQDAILGGADDYFVKGEVPGTALVRAVTYAAKQKRLADERYRNIFDEAILGIYQLDLAGRFLTANPALAACYGYESPEALLRTVTDIGAQLFDDPEQFEEMMRLLATEGGVHDFDVEQCRKDGSRVWLSMDAHVVRDPQGRALYYAGFAQDISLRKVAEAALEAAQRRLVEASRQAGKAEVATNVLHNVGNVLNSVNISAELIAGSSQKSAAEKLERVGALLAGHADDLPGFLSGDAQGAQIPGYLSLLARSLRQDHEFAQAEMVSLRRNIDHIRQIIAVQQDQNRHDTSESIAAADVFADALRINAAAMERHHIQVTREYEPGIMLVSDKHRILQILVNLIRNAKHAFVPMPVAGRRLTLRVEQREGEAVRFWVVDNGMGIAPEHLGRLFEHGFTTRAEGHGFGLHSAALLARELGGSLEAASEGPGRGATFMLEVPLTPPFRE